MINEILHSGNCAVKLYTPVVVNFFPTVSGWNFKTSTGNLKAFTRATWDVIVDYMCLVVL